MHTALARKIDVVGRDRRPSLDGELQQVVNRIWDHASTARPMLVDGSIFSVERVGQHRIEGSFVPYRWFVAQHEMPELHDQLHVRPLAVTGRVMTTDGRWVFGLRSRHTTQDRGRWEFLPSGGVDPTARTATGAVDTEVALRNELLEELAIGPAVGPEVVDDVACIGIVTDGGSHVIDVVFDVAVRCTAADLERHLATHAPPEHDAIRCLRPADLPLAFEPEGPAPATVDILALPRRTVDAR
jgi:hypothetical protein